jgi:hypothetical protein
MKLTKTHKQILEHLAGAQDGIIMCLQVTSTGRRSALAMQELVSNGYAKYIFHPTVKQDGRPIDALQITDQGRQAL